MREDGFTPCPLPYGTNFTTIIIKQPNKRHTETVLTKCCLCYRTGRPSVRPQQVRYGLPQHRVPRVRSRGGAVPGDGRGTRHPGPAASTPHESPAVFLCSARAGHQAEPLVPRILRHSYTPTLQVCSHLLSTSGLALLKLIGC